MKTKRKDKGFTLIELLVVISIIGLLSSVVLVSLNNARQKSRDTRRVADMNQSSKALEMFYNENNRFPTSAASVGAGGIFNSANAPGLSKFLVTFPQSPTPEDGSCLPAAGEGTNVYWYRTDTAGSKYTITFCLGPTNPGGIGTGIKNLVSGAVK